MAKQINNELERVSINVPKNIIKRVKEYADGLGINYTSAYIVLLNQALDQKDMLSKLPFMFNMFNDMKQLSDKMDINDTIDK